MKYLVTSAEMKEYDNNTIERIGIPALVLMERAAMAVRDEILKISGKIIASSYDTTKEGLSYDTTKAVLSYDTMKGESSDNTSGTSSGNVLIVAGSGNNGADGLALARLLKEDSFDITVLECGNMDHATDSYKKQREILAFYDIHFIKDITQAESKYDFVVDGIFGVGLSGTVNEKYANIIECLNGMRGNKIAIDIPSGIDGTTGKVMGCAFKADVTVTFGFGKRGLYFFPGAEYAGKVEVAQISINERGFFGRQPGMFLYDESPAELLPARKRDGNKGTFGKVLLIAGWENMAGAAIMSSKAVLRAGAGMVKVFCSGQNRNLLQCAVPEAMIAKRETLLNDLKWADVIVAGPGLGQSESAAEVVKTILKETAESAKPILLDADALNLIAGNQELQEIIRHSKANSVDNKNSAKRSMQRIIMTPHIGELARLSGKEISYIKCHIVEVAKETCLDYDSVMVCKDARTVVFSEGHPLYLNVTGNSGMATAGSGDVLSGMIGALLAQGQDAFKAACVGVYLHGLAGDAAAGKVSEFGVTATRIISQIEEVGVPEWDILTYPYSQRVSQTPK